MRAFALLILVAGSAAAAPLASPRAEADLACAAYLAWRAEFGNPVETADPAAQSALFASTMAAESEATGTDMLDLIGALQDRMRLMQEAFKKAEATGFAALDGLSLSKDDLGAFEARCAG